MDNGYFYYLGRYIMLISYVICILLSVRHSLYINISSTHRHRTLIRSVFSVGVALVTVLNLSGCTANYTYQIVDDSLRSMYLKDQHRVIRNNNWLLDNSTSVYLGSINVTGNREQNMPRAQWALREKLAEKFAESFPRLHVEDRELSLAEEFVMASLRQANVLIKPRLVSIKNERNTHYELHGGANVYPNTKRATDKVVVQFAIYDVQTQMMLDMSTIVSKQRFYAANASIPTDLFDQGIDTYLLRLTGNKTLL